MLQMMALVSGSGSTLVHVSPWPKDVLTSLPGQICDKPKEKEGRRSVDVRTLRKRRRGKRSSKVKFEK